MVFFNRIIGWLNAFLTFLFALIILFGTLRYENGTLINLIVASLFCIISAIYFFRTKYSIRLPLSGDFLRFNKYDTIIQFLSTLLFLLLTMMAAYRVFSEKLAVFG